MKLLVAVKRVVDYASAIRVRPDKLGVEQVSPKFSMNPFCEIALEEAVRLKEKKIAEEILAVGIGPTTFQDTLRVALAMGADRALHIPIPDKGDGLGGLQPLAVAQLLAAIVQKESPDMVLMGKQAIDGDNNQAGQMLAGLLGWPQATFASRVTPDAAARTVDVAREVDGGSQTLRLRLPAVITADLRLNTPRLPSLINSLKAKKKAIESLSPSDLGVDIESLPSLTVRQVDPPPSRKAGVMVSSVAELVQKLRDEAKVF